MTAIRLVTAAPENNMATAMLPITFPTNNPFRVVTNRRLAFDTNKGGMRPKTWSSTATTTQQTRQPMDKIAATAVTVFTDLKIPMKPSKLAQVTPEDEESYVKAKEGVRKRIWEKWVKWDYPPYYEYRPIFWDCWSFMTLLKFQAGRIHQMRAHKCYLNAHTDCLNQDRKVTCGRCGTEPETLEHVVKCPALASARWGYPPDYFDIAPVSKTWKRGKKGLAQVKGLVSHVIGNRINFPVRGGFFPFMRNADLAS